MIELKLNSLLSKLKSQKIVAAVATLLADFKHYWITDFTLIPFYGLVFAFLV